MSATEAAGSASTPIGGVLAAGIDQLSLQQEVEFDQYVRFVSPADGFVYLVNATVVSGNSYWNAALAAVNSLGLPLQFSAKCSLHYSSKVSQDEEKTIAVNSISFTSESEIVPLNRVSPLVVYFGTIAGVRYSFSERGEFYKQSNVWHYAGDAVYPDLDSVVIESAAGIDTVNATVSNSLPLWLALLGYKPAVALHANPGIPLFPSYCVPKNLAPPYGVVHVEPVGTIGISAAPGFEGNLSQFQLCQDRVRITLLGYRNDAAEDFVAWVGQYTLFTDNFGIQNTPVVRDEKRGQVELNALAQKKTIDFEIDYYQRRANDVARQLLRAALPVDYVVNT